MGCAHLVHITFIAHDGTPRVVDATVGQSVMKAAKGADIPAIEADCGGACACATCQVFVDEAWRERVGLPSEEEDAMLDMAPQRRPGSRLSCQIPVTPLLDGLVVSVPESQY